MTKTSYVKASDGSEVTEQVCILPGWTTDRFVIEIHSCNGVGETDLLDHLQRKWEVRSVDHQKRTTVADNL